MRDSFKHSVAAIALGTAFALPIQASAQEEIPVTVVNGHPAIFLWVQQLTETFIPTVDAALEGTPYQIAWTEAYGGTLADVGGELESAGGRPR